MDKSAVDATFNVNLILLIFVVMVTMVFYDLNIPILSQFIVVNGGLGIAICVTAFLILLIMKSSDDYLKQLKETDNRKYVT
jgi:magnesium-transporting ATPase (P-type)